MTILLAEGDIINDTPTIIVQGVCSFPNCTQRSNHSGYCIGHAKLMGIPPTKKEKKRIARKTSGLASDERKYRKIVKEMLEESNLCEMRTPDCTNIANGCQHKKRRGSNLLKREYLIRSCGPCNLWAELNPLKALEMGIALRVHVKEDQTI